MNLKRDKRSRDECSLLFSAARMEGDWRRQRQASAGELNGTEKVMGKSFYYELYKLGEGAKSFVSVCVCGVIQRFPPRTPNHIRTNYNTRIV